MPAIEKIALFGGTFDPIHEGHVEVARRAVDHLALDQVIFLPCRQSPHKEDSAGASGMQRLEMIKLAIRDHPWARVDDWELQEPGISYSWRTAEVFKQRYPEAALYWLMGRDQWQVFETWNRADYLARLVEFIVHDREGSAKEGQYAAHFVAGEHPASATEIRQAIAKGRKIPAGWLAPQVETYLRQKGLYRSE
ncbi:MAG: nicotinate (nicotinamide) nucleotide adenylyltransferase [Verrucomicrobiota bacterium JB023]|nr:nicotinate (nicotinamide) nucleotide adenylyltransferase [Verrucomicrobiota bacterium JB023]